MREEELIETLRVFEKNSVEQLEEPARKLFYAIMKIADERDRLNNIINELEKWLNEEQVIYRDYLIRTPKFDSDYGANHLTLSNLTNVLDKLQELKGDSSNE